MTDQMWQKCFEKFHAGDFSLDDGYSKVTRPVEVDSYQIETLRTINVIHMGDSHHTQNIETNKVIVENEKSFFYFTEKPIWTFWPTQYISGKIGQKIKSSHIIFSQHTRTTSPTIKIPHQSGTFVKVDESMTYHYHPKSILYIRVDSLRCTIYMIGQKYTDRIPPL